MLTIKTVKLSSFAATITETAESSQLWEQPHLGAQQNWIRKQYLPFLNAKYNVHFTNFSSVDNYLEVQKTKEFEKYPCF